MRGLSLHLVQPRGPARTVLHEVQSLVDDSAVESSHNLVRTWPSGTKANQGEPVFGPEMPWEDDSFPGTLWGTVLYDEHESIFVMWYHAWWRGVAMALSEDGLHWQRPNLGVFDVDEELLDRDGRVDLKKAALLEFAPKGEWATAVWGAEYRGKRNNLIRINGHDQTSSKCCSSFSVTVSERRYFASYDCGTWESRSGMCIAQSRDGATFTALGTEGCAAGNHCASISAPADTLNQMLMQPGSIKVAHHNPAATETVQ